MKKTLNLFLIYFIFACTTVSENFTLTNTNPNEALIYIYYPYNSCGLPQKVYFNDKFVTTLHCGEYKLIKTNAGRKKLSSTRDSIITFDAQAGQTYFIKGKNSRYNTQECLFCNTLHLTLRMIAPDTAINELTDCKKINE